MFVLRAIDKRRPGPTKEEVGERWQAQGSFPEEAGSQLCVLMGIRSPRFSTTGRSPCSAVADTWCI